MLIPVKQLFPFNLGASETKVTELETQLPVTPLLHPRVFFRNVSVNNITVSLDHILDLGSGDDPLLTGSFTTNIFSVVVAPNELLTHEFFSIALSGDIERHQVSLTNGSAISNSTIHMWVEGLFEESMKAMPSYEPIVL